MAKMPPWTERELEYLGENVGSKSDAAMARRLNRSVNAIKIARYRKLNKITHQSTIYSAEAVAAELGI